MRIQRPSYRVVATSMLALGLALAANAAHAGFFVQDNLVTSGPTSTPPGPPAANTDPNLINPWGISYSSTGPFWVSDNNSGFATVYNGAGTNLLTVTVAPTLSSTATPTGQVHNDAGTGFNVTVGGVSTPSVFMFATEDGTISGWAGGKSSVIKVDNSNGGAGAVYKGLAYTPTNGPNGQAAIYATNFRAGTVEVYDSTFTKVATFTDPNAPTGYAPFDVRVLNGKLYVTYALQQPGGHDDQAGPGHGFVDVFSLDGSGGATRLIQFNPSGPLNSPWGLDIAPSGFGNFGGDLLVGNFGDGKINVFDPTTGAFLGTIDDANGNPLVNVDLWGIINGNGGLGGNLDSIYITAGVGNESAGVFASISVPEPGSLAVLAGGLGVLGWMRRRTVRVRSHRRWQPGLAPV